MYGNYRLKIDGVNVPSSYIEKGSYTQVERKRVIEVWTDANMIEHEVAADQPKAEIQFSLIPHDSDQHERYAALVRKLDDITVDYFSDKLNAYRTATFRMEPVQFTHRSSYGGKIQYDSARVMLIEN